MAKIMDKVMGMIGLADEEEELLEEQDEMLEERDEQYRRGKKAPVVALPQQKGMKVVVIEPRSFDEVQSIADNLKNRRSVVVNLEKTDPTISQRIVDFVSGTVYALGGSLQKVGSGIYLFVPNGVDISSMLDNRDEQRDRGIFTWVK